MPDVIPTVLAPYLKQCCAESSLTLLTSTLSTPAHWLVVRLLYAYLAPSYDSDADVVPDTHQPKVVFVSLLRSYGHWLDLCKKINLDITSHGKNGRFCFVDGLIVGTQNAEVDTTWVVQSKSLRLGDIVSSISGCIRALSSTTAGSTSTTIIIDGLDFVLASQADTSPLKLQQFISSVRTQATSLALTFNSDAPLIHPKSDATTPLERHHGILAADLAHKSVWVFQLRGLDTGTAKDVTGVLRVSKGGSHESKYNGQDLDDNEWLYQLRGDGSARVWLRGQ